MTSTFCTSNAVIIKAGKNVSLDFTTGTTPTTFATKAAAIDQFINQAESTINAETRINYTDTYSTLNDDVKKILEDAASSKAAMNLINYDMTNYSSIAEAQTILDVNNNIFERALRLLKEKQTTDFIDRS